MIRRRRNGDLLPRRYWEPFAWRPFNMLDEMDRLFEDFRTDFESFMAVPREKRIQALRTPMVDLLDKGRSYELHAEMPGINKDDVNIEITENLLEISAETKEEKKEEDEKAGYIRRERRYAKFYRKIPMPESVKAEDAVAELKDGILTITLPKIEKPEEKVRKVQVK